MKTHSPSSFAWHVLAGALVAAALMTAATAAAAAPAEVTSETFAPDWQSHAHPLIYLGSAGSGGNEAWLVPPILRKGRYAVISRDGDKAELMQGYQFEVPSDASLRIKLVLPSGYSHVEALPMSDIPRANVPTRDSDRKL
jgi:hypothetical protein